MGIYKVRLYNANRELLRLVRVHAPGWIDAPQVALNRFPEDNATFASVRIR